MKKNNKLLKKFLLLALLMIGYFLYLSIKYDFTTGGIVSILTWSFFVLCTPIADAGFLVDFPLRLLFGIRMVISEVIIWGFAIIINILAINYFPEYYSNNELMKVFYKILSSPYPYWTIIALSCLGTFLSLVFGDELMDVISDKNKLKQHKYKILSVVFIFLLTIFLYYELIASMNLNFEEMHQ